MNQKMTLIDSNNNEIVCDIIANFTNDGKNYVAYTDGSMNNNDYELFVSRYIYDNDKMKLFDIDNDDELQYVNEFLDKYLFDLGDNNE